jgi:hypothetical protein
MSLVVYPLVAVHLTSHVAQTAGVTRYPVPTPTLDGADRRDA